MARREPGKGEGGAKCDARAGIGAAEGGGHVVAAGIEARNRLTGGIKHTGLAVGAQPGGGAKRAGVDFYGIKRRR